MELSIGQDNKGLPNDNQDFFSSACFTKAVQLSICILVWLKLVFMINGMVKELHYSLSDLIQLGVLG